MEINVVQATLDMLNELSEDEVQELGKQMYEDSKLFASICFPLTLTSSLSDEDKIRFIEGTLPQEILFPEHHIRMYEIWDDLLSGRISNASMVLFRKASKTEIKRMMVTKIIAYGMENVVLFISETLGQAQKDIDAIQFSVMTNPILHFFFNDMKGPLWNQKSSSFKSQGKEIFINSMSVNSAARGLNIRTDRVGISILDDFEGEGNSLTSKGREGVKNFVDNKLRHIGEGNHHHKQMFMGTIIHPEAVLAQARHMPKFNNKHGVYYECGISKTASVRYDLAVGKYIIDPYSQFQIGTPVWPATLNSDYLKDIIAETDERDFWKILQEWYNVPRADSKAHFDTSKIKKIKGTFKNMNGITYLHQEFDDGTKKDTIMDVYIGVDPASGRHQGTDDTVIFAIGRLPNDRWVALDIYAGIIEIDEQIDMIVKFIRKYSPRLTCIETVSYQYSLFVLVRNKLKKLNVRARLKQFDRKQSKTNKFKKGLVPLVNGEKISYIEVCSNIDLLLRELANFSDMDDKDDCIDGMYLAVTVAGDRVPRERNVIDLIRDGNKKKDIYSLAIESLQKEKITNYMEY